MTIVLALALQIGSDPGKIAPTDERITRIIPLKHARVGGVVTQLKETLDKCLEPDGRWAISPYPNCLILTGRSDRIRRAALILSAIDVRDLTMRVHALLDADATETSKLVIELLGIKAVADTRTNSIIALATGEDHPMIEEVIRILDGPATDRLQLRRYPLRLADSVTVSRLVVERFADVARPLPWIRIVAAPRTNSVIIAADVTRFPVLEDLIYSLDRPAASP